MTPIDLVRDRDHILVGFDGVLCAVQHDDAAIAERLRVLVSPGAPAATGDPFDVLRYAASCGAATAAAVERQLRRLELPTVAGAPVVPGAASAMRRLAAAGYTLTAISSLSIGVVRSYFALHDLGESVRRIAARTGPDTPLPPDPHLLNVAMRALGAGPERCVLIAGSAADVQAGVAAGVAVIGYAPAPAESHGAALVIRDMAELANAGAAEFTWNRSGS
jgi:beta-phosphoglucomutase-like phosphatase (HAD superfamily)